MHTTQSPSTAANLHVPGPAILDPLLRQDALVYTVAPCSLGFALVATSGQRVRAILLGDDPRMLVDELQQQFSNVSLAANQHISLELVEKAIALIEYPAQAADLPLDIYGTPFQVEVWQALRAIPAGITVSYASIAEQIGAPNSVRAVAQAIAANTLAVAIPCHRVIRSNGELSGYRWGAERKRALINREAGI
jgi:AraC family transcriptional regulator, regulatory protein of adaptative response / methylated-DNA-[protein]-cysteine methyltransferase